MKKAIIFDLDGTLWDATDQTCESFNNVLRKHGYEGVSKKKVCDNFGNNKIQTISHFFPDFPYEIGNKLIDEIDDDIIENIDKNDNIIYPGVSEVLDILSKKYSLFIVSNNAHGSYIEKFLKAGNFYAYFKDYVAASELSITKSEAIKQIIENNMINRAVYVGDTDKDKIAADECGIPFIQSLYGFGEDLNCIYKINNVLELINCIEDVFD